MPSQSDDDLALSGEREDRRLAIRRLVLQAYLRGRADERREWADRMTESSPTWDEVRRQDTADEMEFGLT